MVITFFFPMFELAINRSIELPKLYQPQISPYFFSERDLLLGKNKNKINKTVKSIKNVP